LFSCEFNKLEVSFVWKDKSKKSLKIWFVWWL
jgi:hypothetical protein